MSHRESCSCQTCQSIRSGLTSQISWVKNGWPFSGIEGDRDSSSSCGIHDDGIRRWAMRITVRSWDFPIFLGTTGSILTDTPWPTPTRTWASYIRTLHSVLEMVIRSRAASCWKKVTNRSISGVHHLQKTSRSYPLMDHSVGWVYLILTSQSDILLNFVCWCRDS